jgi:arylsulfatase A-like enzyme
MEQEETRAIRTEDWLYAARFKGAPSFTMRDELYDLRADPLEKNNLIEDPEYAATAAALEWQIKAFFADYSAPAYDLWNGGSAKSNVTYDKLWIDAWGSDWQPKISG